MPKSKTGPGRSDGRKHNVPPEHGKIKPREIRNKWGRAGKPKACPASTMDELFQEEARRIVSHDSNGPVEARKRLIQEEYLAAFREGDSAVRARLLRQNFETDARIDGEQYNLLDFVYRNKARLSDQFYLAQREGRPPPDVLPHPDHVKVVGGEYLPIDQLVASPRNARTHSKKQIALIADSITRFGMVTPVGIGPDNQLIYGHARVEAAKIAGLEAVPVVRLDHLNSGERRAYLLADNQLALEAGWDRKILALELKELAALDFSLPALGFSLPEIDKIYEDLADSSVDGTDAEDDALPIAAAQIVTRSDDLWLLGNHRLVQGDARAVFSYERLLDDEKIDVVFADPPYNVRIENNVSGLGKVRHSDFAMASGEMSAEQFTDFLTDGFRPAADRMRDGAIAFVCMDWRHITEMQAAGLAVFDELKNICIWNKRQAGMGAFYRSKYEMVFVFKKGTAPHTNTFGLGGEGRHRSFVARQSSHQLSRPHNRLPSRPSQSAASPLADRWIV